MQKPSPQTESPIPIVDKPSISEQNLIPKRRILIPKTGILIPNIETLSATIEALIPTIVGGRVLQFGLGFLIE